MNDKLHDLLKYAEVNNAFYKERFKNASVSFLSDDSFKSDKFNKIPILYKKDIISNYDTIISNGQFIDKLEKQQTSGSTGEPLWIYKTPQELYKQSLHLWQYRKSIADIFPKDRYIRTHISQRTGESISVPSIIENDNWISLNVLSVNLSDLNEYYKIIVDFQPKWFLVSPSFLHLMSDFIISNKLDVPNITYIELTGEFIPSALKTYFNDTWNCQISNHYGCRELYGIALECGFNNLHVVTDNVFVEVNSDEKYGEGYGEILLTSLTNKAMPFIRYNIGDIGKLNYTACECGNKSPILELLGGRQSEYIETDCHRKIHSSIFHYVIKKVNIQNSDAVLKFQLKKQSDGFILLVAIKDKINFPYIANQIKDELDSYIKDTKIVVEQMHYDSSYIQKSGKFAHIV